MSQLAPDTQEMLNSLRAAVTETLERKRRLGQYAVIWKDGKPELAGLHWRAVLLPLSPTPLRR